MTRCLSLDQPDSILPAIRFRTRRSVSLRPDGDTEGGSFAKARKEALRLLSARYRSQLYRRFKCWKITNSIIAQSMSAEDLETARQEMKQEMGHARALERFRIDNQFEGNATLPLVLTGGREASNIVWCAFTRRYQSE